MTSTITTKVPQELLNQGKAGKTPASLTYGGRKLVEELLESDLTWAVRNALSEDLGLSANDFSPETLPECDITSSGLISPNVPATASMLVKEPGVVAGLLVAQRTFYMVDPDITFEVADGIADGSVVTHTPHAIATISGPARSLLIAERVALNFIQRLSGIATITKKLTDKVREFGIIIVDTRKTTPGLRTLEKYAVSAGGGVNHRYGLYDAILIKDNHIRVAGGVTNAINGCRAKHPSLPVEVEVTNQSELKEALALKAEKVLLDNMTPAQIRQSIEVVAGRAVIEVSGGVNAQNIDEFLIQGVDAISIGALTHSIRSLDISLEIEV